MKKNLLLTFCFSFIPGAGQMYQNYMKRGLSIMVLAGMIFACAIVIGTPIFVIPLLIILAYSFFDTFNLRNMSEEKRENYVDEYVWDNGEFKNLLDLDKFKSKSKIIGYILLALGAYLLVDSLIFRTLAYVIDSDYLYNLINSIRSLMPTILASVTAIYVGFKMISSKKGE